ncbi:IS256 family transposase [Corynebacterium diphtheriae]|uniref:Mutator family transposase n=1 Tax=Corynebacterium diphtheriae TaxID=1717 RepID=A0A811G3V2_CORDP|nr:IS256 family transposase [Corynebacterium diphtheriae]CAB0616357.1 IS256 family transposase [Corynebacterium diphtheriae]CAB0618125.1 IS256 family transposase [Corynebacterium diphtheriae]CAB0619624.1 IS256 family transposase [Corynebacterium diphtheriae]CAB0619805.1 IS256 family transposase [Corynebacterium diphtheriae]
MTRPEEKLLAHPKIAKLIDKLGTSTTDAHLGYQSGDREAKAAAGIDNDRNGTYLKTVDSNDGPVTIDVPRDWAGTFLPTMVPKGSRRLTDVDDVIISLYAGGMIICDI